MEAREEHPSAVRILDHLPAEHVDEALTILFEAFRRKFRHGFRDADDFSALFRRDIQRQHCFTAVIDDRLLGIATISSSRPPREFYRAGLWHLLTTFNPIRTLRVWFNLFLLSGSAPLDQLMVESIAVSPDARGLGVGTKLMNACEELARSESYPTISLDVIGENVGAIKLYERLGYTIVRTTSGFWVRLATEQETVHRMQMPLSEEG